MSDAEKSTRDAKIIGGITIVGGLVGLYLLFVHKWDDKKEVALAGKTKKRKK